MAKEWQGTTYNEDWVPIDAQGNATGEKDMAASDANSSASSPWGGASSSSASTTTPAAGTQNSANTATGTTVGSTWQPIDNAVMGKLVSDINLPASVDQTDPAYRQQIDANQLQTNLAADRSRAAMAQRRAATGTGTSGAVDTDVNKVLEQQAYQDKTFEGQTLDKFRQQNLDKAARALTLGTGALTAEQERQLRDKLTMEGYDVQRDLSADQLAYQRDALGQQLALSQAQMDQNAMLALMGGGG